MDARLSRYSYLVSLLPRQVVTDLDLDVRLIRRRYSSFTPVPSRPVTGLLVDTGDQAATAAGVRRAHRRAGGVCGVAGLLRPGAPPRPAGLPDRARAAAHRGARSRPWSATTRSGRRWCAGRSARCSRREFADDTVRGIVATDALIGTFAEMGSADLRQNVCFLYHLIGGGTGDWDVPVGGMGAVTDGLARAAVAAGAEIRTGVTGHSRSTRTAWCTWEGGSARAGTIHAACAPTVLNTLLTAAGADAGPDRGGARGRAAQGQHAARRGCRGCATSRSTPRPPSPAPSTSTRATPSCRRRMPPLRPAGCRSCRRARSTATACRTARSSGPSSPPATPRR